MTLSSKNYLIAAGIANLSIALLHIFIILGGPDWYRFFGAGEGMAQLADHGHMQPIYTTATIALIFLIWSLYAFSAAGIIIKLPLTKAILMIISMIYFFRALFFWPLVILIDDPYLNELKARPFFMILSSLISFMIGFMHIKGIKKRSTF